MSRYGLVGHGALRSPTLLEPHHVSRRLPPWAARLFLPGKYESRNLSGCWTVTRCMRLTFGILWTPRLGTPSRHPRRGSRSSRAHYSITAERKRPQVRRPPGASHRIYFDRGRARVLPIMGIHRGRGGRCPVQQARERCAVWGRSFIPNRSDAVASGGACRRKPSGSGRCSGRMCYG